jgi:N-ethylmaleimide reductase
MTQSNLFHSLTLGGRQLAHRIVLAPMTRTRADEMTLAPTTLSVEYYAQRASAGGLLITEATHISPEATPTWTIYSAVRDRGGQVPGIWTDAQVTAWRQVTAAVHARGGLISCQLLHTGRIAQPGIGEHPLVQGTQVPLPPVSSSATPLGPGKEAGDYNWDRPAAVPRALETVEIERVIEDYCHAARNAARAGFDFVELHAAHGYLIEQFLCDGINRRNDRYGGSIENRCRLLFEIVDALLGELGPNRVGVRLSPTVIDPATGQLYQTYFNATDSDPQALYTHAVQGLSRFPLAYLMLTEPRVGALSIEPELDPSTTHPLRNAHLREFYDGPLIGAGGFTPRSAKEAVACGIYDLIAFGRWFLSTPDLPARLASGAPLNRYERSHFYGGGAAGYIDYPDLAHLGAPGYGDYTQVEQSDIGVSMSSSDIIRSSPTPAGN